VAAGAAPLSTQLRAAFAAGTAAITKVEWTIDGTASAQSDVPYTFPAGFHEATLRVDAADGQVCTATLPIVALAAPGRVPPLIVSEPPEASACGAEWTYEPTALGAGPLSWTVSGAPSGMTVNPTTGALSWTPDPRLGLTTFTLTALGDGASYAQTVTLKAPCSAVALQTCGCGASGGLPALCGAALLWLGIRVRRRSS
jgi:hypothetical protein